MRNLYIFVCDDLSSVLTTKKEFDKHYNVILVAVGRGYYCGYYDTYDYVPEHCFIDFDVSSIRNFYIEKESILLFISPRSMLIIPELNLNNSVVFCNLLAFLNDSIDRGTKHEIKKDNIWKHILNAVSKHYVCCNTQPEVDLLKKDANISAVGVVQQFLENKTENILPYEFDLPFMCFAGRINYERGIDISVDAFLESNCSNLSMGFVGNPTDDSLLINIKKIVNNWKKCFCVLMPGSRIKHSLTASCEFMVESHRIHSGGSYSVLSGFHYNRTAIVRDTPENRSIFKDCVLYWKNEQEFAAMIKYFNEPNNRIEYENKIKDFDMEKFSVAVYANKWKDLFDKYA